ncbi:MAG TPA: TIGR00730 family Rossman fold protein [Candidatus Binataceae bacterium]|nr:TIGR00730 family Rossman fold protein [Candidatus Binataceae bacterium]
MEIKRVCVYCASSNSCDPVYHDVARRLGRELSLNDVTIVYGGGRTGSMGHLAEGAIAEGGRVIGVVPQFMYDLEWSHRGLSELVLVRDMHERKRLMIAEVDAVVALAGGCGTFEELFEAMAWKRLGLFGGAIVIVNTRDFYRPCLDLLELSIRERFMDERHRAMWSVVVEPEQVLAAVKAAPAWPHENRSFAVI